MKLLFSILGCYFLLLIAVPSLQAVKRTYVCESGCSRQSGSDATKGCEKDKCILNFNCCMAQYVVPKVQELVYAFAPVIPKKVIVPYDDKWISTYENSIWHPPKEVRENSKNQLC